MIAEGFLRKREGKGFKKGFYESYIEYFPNSSKEEVYKAYIKAHREVYGVCEDKYIIGE